MRVNFNSVIVSKETKISKQTNREYGLVSFMDGTNILKAVVDESIDFNGIPVLEECNLNLDVTFGKYPKINLLDVK